MSDLSAEQAVGTVAGGVIGFFIGGPVGAARGAYWGYGIGSAFTTTELDAAEGPRMDDRKIQASRYGEFLPRVYNNEKLTGSIIWVKDNTIEEVSHTDTATSGGKGGETEQKVTTFSYQVTMAVAICEGPISGLSKIWADNVLIYDMSDSTNIGAVAESLDAGGDITIYLGTSDQMPNSIIELEKGTGEVPAFRGVAYIVLRRFKLESYGNRIPNLSFEVLDTHTTDYTPTDVTHYLPADIDNTDLPGFPQGDPTKTEYQIAPWYSEGGKMYFIRSSSVVAPFFSGITGSFYDPRVDRSENNGEHVDTLRVSVVNMPYNYEISKHMSDFSVVSNFSRIDSFPWDIPGDITDYRNFQLRPVDNGKDIMLASWVDNEASIIDGGGSSKRMAIGFKLGRNAMKYYRIADETTSVAAFQDNVVAAERQGYIYISAVSATDMINGGFGDLYVFATSQLDVGLVDGYHTEFTASAYLADLISPVRSIDLSSAGNNVDISWGLDNYSSALYVIDKTNELLYSYNETLGPIGTPIDISDLMIGYSSLGKRIAVRDNVIHISHWNDGTARQVMRVWIINGNEVTQDAEIELGEDGSYSFHQSIIDIHPSMFMYANNATIGATGGARASGIIQTIPAFTDFPKFTVPGIVGLEMDRIDVITSDDYDTGGLAGDLVEGYMVTNPSPVSSILKPLQQAFRFDVYEEDYKIKFKTRGVDSSSEILTPADIRAHEKGSEAPQQAIRVMKNPNNVPGRIEIIYKSKERDYEEGFSYADRLTVDRNSITKLQLPLIMTADNAYKTADILLLDIERESKGTYEIVLPFRYSHLERTQIITLSTDYETEINLRIVNIEKGAPGLVKITAVQEDGGNYTSNAVGFEGDIDIPTLSSVAPSKFMILDLPMLDDSHDNPGIYYGIVPGVEHQLFRGATVFAGNNSTQEYNIIETVMNPLSVGLAVDKLDGDDIDTMFTYKQSLTVFMKFKTLETRTEEQVRANANMLAYGRHGNWEIIKFLNSELVDDDTYKLTGLLRGYKGTQWAMENHQEADEVILLELDSLYRMAMDNSNGFRRWGFIPVTLGTAYDPTNIAIGKTTGACITTNAVNHIQGHRNAAGDLTITWRPSARFNLEWIDGYGTTPHDNDTFLVYIKDSINYANVRLLRADQIGQHSIVYTIADQIEDWITPQAKYWVRILAFGDAQWVLGEGDAYTHAGTNTGRSAYAYI